MIKNMLKRVLTAAMLLVAVVGHAQQLPAPQELKDPNVRTGKLANGLTYYIRHNEYPKGQADFHIAQRVGAVQEEENQNGLAHFLEHMCFNGTKNFPDKKILTWLESKGVKFGVNLNAHTGTDETVYDIKNVPVGQESVVDSCLLILHDWADALTLADDEIDKERGVIHEEWRMGNGAIARTLDRHAPELYPGTKYATHNVIGKMDIIDHFKPQVLRDYYEKWYRPDLQGIIVVGDVDVDKVEAKIKELFSPIKMPANPAKFEYSLVGDNEKPIVISDKDKEMPYNILFVAKKFDLMPRELRNTDLGVLRDYIDAMIESMLGQRLQDIALGDNPPFAQASVSIGSYLYASTKGALMVQAVVNDKGSDAALRAVLTELKRVQKYGFTPTEFERAFAEYKSNLEKHYKNRATDKNALYAQTYIDNFINNNPIVGIDYIYPKIKDMPGNVALINQYVQQAILTDKNLVVLSMCPDKPGVTMPTVAQLQKDIDDVAASKVEAYVDDTVTEPLMSELPKPGKTKKVTENKALGYTKLVLSNGATVLLKPTKFKDDEIRMTAVSEGGVSLYPGKDYPNASMAADVISSTGLGKFKLTDLQKMMSGKQATVTPYISDYTEGMNGTSTPKDLETMMQLVYLNFTQPRQDRAAFDNIKKSYLDQVKNLVYDPQYIFQDSLVRNLYGHHPKAMIQSPELFAALNYDRVQEIYKERFANAADFTFIFVGNFDVPQMTKYVEQYIGSLPAVGKKEKPANDGKSIVSGLVRKEFKQKNESKLAMLGMVWSGKLPYTLENIIKVNIAGQLMANQLLNSVREDEGAAYSPYSVGTADRSYEDYFVIQTAFGLNPSKYASSEKLTIASLEKLAKNIPESELSKMKEYMVKKADENAHENGYWVNVLKTEAVDGVDLYTGYKNVVNSLTPAEMQKFVASLLKQGNRFELLMLPE